MSVFGFGMRVVSFVVVVFWVGGRGWGHNLASLAELAFCLYQTTNSYSTFNHFNS